MTKTARLERALGYVRVSAPSPTTASAGIDIQETRLRDHYRRRGFDLIEIYRDTGIAGTTDDRPGLQALFAHAVRPGTAITEIGVHSLSRLFRDRALLEHYRRKMAEADVRIVAITGNVWGGPTAAITRRSETRP